MVRARSPTKPRMRVKAAPMHFLEKTVDVLRGSTHVEARTELRILQTELSKDKVEVRKTRMEELATAARELMQAVSVRPLASEPE